MANNGETLRRAAALGRPGATLGHPGATAVSAVRNAGDFEENAHGGISPHRAVQSELPRNANSARLTQPWHPIVLLALLFLLGAADTLAERRARIAALPPAEQQQLLARQERFHRLPPAEQEKLRRLDEQLAGSTRQAELRTVMAAYHEWLKTLNPSQRDQLRQLPPAARVARIKELREQESKRNVDRLAEVDYAPLRTWLLALIPPSLTDEQRKELEQRPEAERENYVLFIAGQTFRTRPGQRLPDWAKLRELLTEDRVNELRATLSAPAQQQLDARADWDGPYSKRWLVITWVWQWLAHLESQRPEFPSPEEMREALLEYFENDLSDERRERLMTLSREQRMRELSEEYWRSQGAQGFSPSRRDQRREERREQRPPRGDASAPPVPTPGSQ